jgi:hypothetical protein
MAVDWKRGRQGIVKNRRRFTKIYRVLLEIGDSLPGIPGERHRSEYSRRLESGVRQRAAHFFLRDGEIVIRWIRILFVAAEKQLATGS